jgi:hypothetical protein
MCWSCDRIAPICAHIAQKDWEGYCESSVFDEEFSIAAIKKKRPKWKAKTPCWNQPPLQPKEVERIFAVSGERTFRPGMINPPPSLP